VSSAADLPWAVLTRPLASTTVNTRRVADSTHDFYWGVDATGRVLLILLLEDEGPPTKSLPRLRGIEIAVQDLGGTSGAGLLLALTEDRYTDLFGYLCRDVVKSAASATSNQEAVQAVLMRTLRWHALLKRGTGRLSVESQQGLIGELLFMEDELLPRRPSAEAIDAWKGPEGGPKDFVIRDAGIEVKTRSATGQDVVRISSEGQLARAGFADLFLFVVDVQKTTDDRSGSFTLRQVVDRVRASVDAGAPQAVEAYDSKLVEAGYLDEDDYSEIFWAIPQVRLFEVLGEFPRIDGGTELSPAVSRVEYSLDLQFCDAFLRERDALQRVLE
jgi:hypothetical protein